MNKVTTSYRFGRFELDFATRQLLADGQPVALGARALDILLTLIERRERLVTKDELLELVWPGLVVEENNLQVQISALRKVLGAQTIATVSGRGYRFAAALDTSEESPVAVAASSQAPSSIAVLPFLNTEGDPEKDYFADGMTEDIITELSRWRSLAVTSRNSTFRFKGQSVDTQQIGRELGVRFLVEGSVRRMGERLRVTAQLNDAETGKQVWGERFDRPVADLFAVQDEVVHTIVGTLVGRVQASGADRVRRKPPSSLDAYDQMLRGNALPWDDPASAAEAKRAFERAIELDPEYGLPYSLLAALLSRQWHNDLSGSQQALDRTFALAQRGVELADDESTCHTILGQLYLERRLFDQALHHTTRGVEINPANQWNQADLGLLLCYIGRAEEALEMLRNARHMDPYFGPRWYWRGLGLAQFVLRRYADALPDLERGVTNNSLWSLAILAACCAKLGHAERARETVACCLAFQPGATVDRLLAKFPFRDVADSSHLAECLRLAGMPE
jgi:adenylate cyclase